MVAMWIASRAAGASLPAQFWRGLVAGAGFAAAIAIGAVIIRWLGDPASAADAEHTAAEEQAPDMEPAAGAESAPGPEPSAAAEAAASATAAASVEPASGQGADSPAFVPLVPPKVTTATVPAAERQASGHD